MTDLVIPAPGLPTVPTTTGGRFPVRRVFCVGRNYAAHAREMGHDPDREPPFFFSKPADAVVVDGADTPYPPATERLEHEVELVVAIGVGGADITEAHALDHVWGYAVGLDLTRRDLQAEAKRLGRPWDAAKGFDASAPIGAITPAAGVDPSAGAVELRVDGALRQAGDLADQIWSVGETIAALSRSVALAPGDLVMTGTPEGVGVLRRGQVLDGTIAGVGAVHTRIV
ncbi:MULTISPECIES: fumarylacetoacetate hydrolase family protein [unclassified Curtobacterium]|uniref:fumarylacetoacetate hydrolase family protein n=1 Tax=unclassified Curtobacterium TaxID=257496 RepID=UPI0008DD6D2B|nr:MULTISPECIES: fumarylacetoacetate hydrolase family protein [unclassified Curtobacterium]OIH99879.1 fumarylacetoacetate hydrolase [Curtobacterium sp. MCBA15_003]OII14422.1 fumarylacetoacetate hydrolase [Curtobacterium sp. MCBA15_009]OII32707.1 fumarylacetoacetate hydrolase [Curtobacterium sp. MMLR14_006]WIE65214.1 fumarylacetoacetate hydrolase family protein [Curtobacterium sp. MCLR17_036]